MHRLWLTVYRPWAEVICHTFDFIIFLREPDGASFKFVYRQAQAQRSRFTFSKPRKLMYFWSWKKNSALTVGLKFYAVIGKLGSVGFADNLMTKVKFWRSIADYPQINRFDSEVCLNFKSPLVRKLSRTPNRTLNLNKWSSFVNLFFFCASYARKISLSFSWLRIQSLCYPMLRERWQKEAQNFPVKSFSLAHKPERVFLRCSQVDSNDLSLRQQWERLLWEGIRSGKSLIQRRKYSTCHKVHCLTKYKTKHSLL